MERFRRHLRRPWVSGAFAGFLLFAYSGGVRAATELPNFWLSVQSPEIEFPWVQVAPEDAHRTTLAVDLREIQNLSSGFVTIRIRLGCPGEPPIWSTTYTPRPPTQPGRFLLAVPHDVGTICEATLTLDLDVSAARGAARDRPISVRGALSYQPVVN
jgi:hypothetical protein